MHRHGIRFFGRAGLNLRDVVALRSTRNGHSVLEPLVRRELPKTTNVNVKTRIRPHKDRYFFWLLHDREARRLIDRGLINRLDVRRDDAKRQNRKKPSP